MDDFPTDETWSSEGPQCPSCGHTITPDEGCYYDEQNYTDDTCPRCNASFKVEVCHSVQWKCEPVTEPEVTEPRDA